MTGGPDSKKFTFRGSTVCTIIQLVFVLYFQSKRADQTRQNKRMKWLSQRKCVSPQTGCNVPARSQLWCPICVAKVSGVYTAGPTNNPLAADEEDKYRGPRGCGGGPYSLERI